MYVPAGGNRAVCHRPDPAMETPRSLSRHYSSLRASDQIQKATTALEALEHEPEIVAAMTPRKYTAPQRIAEGRALLDAVRDVVEDRTERVGDRLSATAAQNDRLAGARAVYAPLAGTARAVFQDERDVLVALGLKGKHLNSYAARIERYRAFAVEARKPARLARFAEETDDIDATDFDELEAAIDAAEAGLSEQDRKASRSQDASEGRRAAFKALEKWMLRMQGHARVVLRGRPQLLEMLGVPPRR